MANKVLVSLPEKFLKEVDRAAVKEHRSRSELIREALRAYLDARQSKNVAEKPASYTVDVSKVVDDTKAFPNIEMVKFTGGTSAVIRGTRVKVSHIVGYLQVGETPEIIANEILPHITLLQIYEAIRYYFVHQVEIDKEREENTEEASRRYLLEKLGEKKYKEITGG